MPVYVKGFAFGLIVMFVIVLIPSYRAAWSNYELRKTQYEGFLFVTENCGHTPTDECLRSICEDRGYWGVCEAVMVNHDQALRKEYEKVFGQITWENYTRSDKPSILHFLVPNLRDGMAFYGMMGISPIFILLSPILAGLGAGFVIDLKKYFGSRPGENAE